MKRTSRRTVLLKGGDMKRTSRETALRGGYRVFQKGGLRPAMRNAGGGGGGGGAVRFRPDTKSGGGGAVHLRPDTKSEVGGGGVLSGASGPIQKAGKGEGLFSRRGGVTIYERGGCNPQTPPLDPPLALLKGRNTIQLPLKHLKGVGIGMTLLSDWLNVLPRGLGTAGVRELPLYHPKVCYGMLY